MDIRRNLRDGAQRELAVRQGREKFRSAQGRSGDVNPAIGFVFAESQPADAVIEGRRVASFFRKAAAIRFAEAGQEIRNAPVLVPCKSFDLRQQAIIRQGSRVIHTDHTVAGAKRFRDIEI
jgi:hypothetical protein